MALPFDPDDFISNYDLPLQLVSAVQSHTHDAQGVRLMCSTTRYQRRYQDRYGTTVEVGESVGEGTPVQIGIHFHTAEIVRLRMVVGEQAALPANHTPMLVDDFAADEVDVQVEELDGCLHLTTNALRVTVYKSPWRLMIADVAGTPLFDTIPAAVYQHPPTGMSGIDGASMTDAWPWFFRQMFPLGFAHDPETGQTQTFQTARVHYDEHFYGFGEKFSTLDKRGQKIALWHMNATGNTWPASYKNVPFFMSSRGYGLFVNSAYPVTYHMGDQSHTHYSLHLQHDVLDNFFIYGPTFKEILPRYTSLTGQPALPPRWSFGLWMSRMSYREQTEVEQVAHDLRARDIPCDVIHIDTDWFERPWINDLTFSEERFPDPAGMIAALREQGYRVTLWQIPYISPQSAFWQEALDGGYFVQQADGTPYEIEGFFGKAAVIDYSNPEAVAWMQGKLDDLFDMGVAAIKTDFGEGAPHDSRAHYANGEALAMHNLYPLLYNRAFYEKTAEYTGEGIVWGRSAYAGSQRYPVLWGGDPAALWGDLGNLWRGGLGLGLCGFPFWSVDIGGFGGTPSPELYIRWAQAGLFVSHPRAHGPIAREPWAFGEQAAAIFRRYAKLRYALMPYVWSEAHACVETSTPMMRPLVLDWQTDPTTAHIDDQFLFGRWLMVAPILDKRNERQVYFPEGTWIHYDTQETVHGPRWERVTSSLETLPLYVRAGAILPMAPDMDYVEQKPWDPLTLRLYPHGETTYTLYDEHDQHLTVRCRQENGRVIVTLPADERQYRLRVYGVPAAQQVTVDGAPVTSWQVHNGDSTVIDVHGKSTAQEVTIEI